MPPASRLLPPDERTPAGVPETTGGPGTTLVDRLSRERHERAFEGGYGVKPAPPGFRAEDYMGLPELDGYYPLADAAEMMGRSVEDVTKLAQRFVLSYRIVGATVYVRPAIIGP